MNPFTATLRLLRLRRHAQRVLDLGDAAVNDRALYRSANYWARLLAAVRAVWHDLPLPKEIRDMEALRRMLTNYKTTIGGVAILAALAAKVVNNPATAFDADSIAMLGAGWAALMAKDHSVTGVGEFARRQ